MKVDNFFQGIVSHTRFSRVVVKFFLAYLRENGSLISNLFEELRKIFHRNESSTMKFFIEFPFTALCCLMSEISSLKEILLSNGKFDLELQTLSIGSIIDVAYFVNRWNLFPKKWIEIDFNLKLIRIHFYITKIDKETEYRLDINFETIRFIVIDGKYLSNDSENNDFRFYLELDAPPFLYVCTKFNDRLKKKTKIQWNRIDNIFSNFNDNNNDKSLQSSMINDQQPCSKDDNLFGYSFGYRMAVNGKNVLNVIIYLSYVCKDLMPNFSLYMSNVQEASKARPMNLELINEKIDDFFNDEFALNYACKALFYRSYTIMDSLTYDYSLRNMDKFFDNLIEIMNNSPSSSSSFVEELLYSLCTLYETRIFNLNIDLKYLVNGIQRKSLMKPKQSYDRNDHVLVRRADLSPTRIYFNRPIILLRSRFANIANLDYALRLNICDDNKRQISSFNADTYFIRKSIKPKLLSGIRIGDRLYEFLGSSSSQMRDSGVIFYAKDDHQPPLTSKTIREIIGDLSKYKRKVAKYVSRLGLIFSQAMVFYQCEDTTMIVKAADLTTHDKEFCFSDGIGIISKRLAQKFLPLLRLPENYFPSAFQIRHGGSKGMLVCYDDYKKDIIIFRDSMIKFESDDRSLGILKFSMARLLYLNRPFIQILEQQHVPEYVFHRMFIDNTKSLMNALIFEKDALKTMLAYSNRNLPFKKLYNAGLSILNEPFMRRILHHLIRYRLDELKSRARIRLPHSFGRTAFGVIDETQKLNPGEIFFQYSELDDRNCPTENTFIIDNEIVMVTKFPCLSLGDVRKFRAVNIPELSHVKDCIVFPAKGDRPHADEMGGSDLDGDEFAVIWRSDLIFPGDNYKPLDFTSETDRELSEDLNISDIIDFYCNFLVENNVGIIANCHLMFADFHPKGLFSEECEELAKKYSISLDYQKNGVNSTIKRKLKPNKNWIRPDFVDKNSFNNCYLSPKILGQFYRKCSLLESVIYMSDKYLLFYEENCTKRPQSTLTIDGWRKYENEATAIYIDYCHYAVETMEMMGIDSEAALISNVYEDKSDASGLIFDRLFEYFNEKFQLQSKDFDEKEKLLLISAWYTICFEKCHLLQFHFRNQPLIGLPFLIPEELIKLISFKHRYQQQQQQKVNISMFMMENNSTLIELTVDLLLYWIHKMNEMFKYEIKSKIKIDLNGEFMIIGEEEWMRNLIKKKLLENGVKKIHREYFENNNDIIMNSGGGGDTNDSNQFSIIILFEYILYWLSDAINYSNELIRLKQIEEIIFLRYSIYAINFVKILNNKCLETSLSNDQIIEMYRKLIDRKFEQFNTMKKWISTRFLTGAIYHMDIYDQENFQIMNGSINCTKFYHNKSYMRKSLKYYPYQKQEQSNDDIDFDQMNNLNYYKIEHYRIEVIGFNTTISLLRLLLGHPNFYSNVYRKIVLPKSNNIKKFDLN
uniref:RNA-dependent RNA polymerase n=1 Tax=Psoroptes ovis TaxID=83912 RepID=A0A3B0QJR3_PSOOV|nr:RNA-dependent RNApolymerase 1-like [Psoroptes ovis]